MKLYLRDFKRNDVFGRDYRKVKPIGRGMTAIVYDYDDESVVIITCDLFKSHVFSEYKLLIDQQWLDGESGGQGIVALRVKRLVTYRKMPRDIKRQASLLLEKLRAFWYATYRYGKHISKRQIEFYDALNKDLRDTSEVIDQWLTILENWTINIVPDFYLGNVLYDPDNNKLVLADIAVIPETWDYILKDR